VVKFNKLSPRIACRVENRREGTENNGSHPRKVHERNAHMGLFVMRQVSEYAPAKTQTREYPGDILQFSKPSVLRKNI